MQKAVIYLIKHLLLNITEVDKQMLKYPPYKLKPVCGYCRHNGGQ